MDYTYLGSQLVVMIGIFVGFVNIITEIAKKLHNFKTAESINQFVTIISVVITVAGLFAYWQLNKLQITWYIIGSFIAVGFMVAYAAMFGFDKLWKHFKKE